MWIKGWTSTWQLQWRYVLRYAEASTSWNGLCKPSECLLGRNNWLALFALGRETGLRISGFGANTSAGNIPQCYCLRHCCKDNDSKLDMAAELQDTLPETGAHVFSPNGQLVYLSAVVEQGFLQKVTLSKQWKPTAFYTLTVTILALRIMHPCSQTANTNWLQ